MTDAISADQVGIRNFGTICRSVPSLRFPTADIGDVFDGGVERIGRADRWEFGGQRFGREHRPAISVVEVGQSLSGNVNGAGVLIVKDGASFSIGNGLCYEGVIVLLGSSTLTGSGNAIVYGSVVTIDHTGKTINASGNVSLYYSSSSLQNVSNMDKLQRIQRKSWREVS